MIPKTFTLVNRKWKVRTVTCSELQKELDRFWNDPDNKDREPVDASDCKGLCDQGEAIIYLNTDRHHVREDLEHTFLHELIHALFYANGLHGHDESFVDRMGGFLHQYLQTQKGEH